MSLKKKVLFVGSFKSSAKDGSVGGQMFACRSLIGSRLSERIDWILLDTTSPSVPPPSFLNRLTRAIIRLFKFVFQLTFKRPQSILIFTADGFSFLEKGVMALIGKLYSKSVILAPRSGYIPRDLEESRVLKLFIPYVLKKVDYVICQGESWRSLFLPLVGMGNEKKLVVLKNWIDTSNECEQSLRSPSKTLQILFLGWIEKSKGVFDLFDVAANILPGTDNIEFIFAGDGSARDELISMAKEKQLEKKIHFPGWVAKEKKKEILCGSDIFVLPSYFEGFPNSLLEGMLASNACIATSVGSIPDVLEHGHNGFLLKEGDRVKLQEILETLINDKTLRYNVSTNGRLRVLSSHSIECAEKELEKIL